jgi:hypothetical protein
MVAARACLEVADESITLLRVRVIAVFCVCGRGGGVQGRNLLCKQRQQSRAGVTVARLPRSFASGEAGVRSR